MVYCPICRRMHLEIISSDITLFDANRVRISSKIICSNIKCTYNKEISTYIDEKELKGNENE